MRFFLSAFWVLFFSAVCLLAETATVTQSTITASWSGGRVYFTGSRQSVRFSNGAWNVGGYRAAPVSAIGVIPSGGSLTFNDIDYDTNGSYTKNVDYAASSGQVWYLAAFYIQKPADQYNATQTAIQHKWITAGLETVTITLSASPSQTMVAGDTVTITANGVPSGLTPQWSASGVGGITYTGNVAQFRYSTGAGVGTVQAWTTATSVYAASNVASIDILVTEAFFVTVTLDNRAYSKAGTFYVRQGEVTIATYVLPAGVIQTRRVRVPAQTPVSVFRKADDLSPDVWVEDEEEIEADKVDVVNPDGSTDPAPLPDPADQPNDAGEVEPSNPMDSAPVRDLGTVDIEADEPLASTLKATRVSGILSKLPTPPLFSSPGKVSRIAVTIPLLTGEGGARTDYPIVFEAADYAGTVSFMRALVLAVFAVFFFIVIVDTIKGAFAGN